MNDGLFKLAHGIASICETSLILVTTRIFSCQLGTARESFVTGIEQMVPKEPDRSKQNVPDRSSSQQSVGFALSKTDPDHHNLEARLFALCGALI